eukprot:1161090-Pelagomonas_calceolata.AAC.2
MGWRRRVHLSIAIPKSTSKTAAVKGGLGVGMHLGSLLESQGVCVKELTNPLFGSTGSRDVELQARIDCFCLGLIIQRGLGIDKLGVEVQKAEGMEQIATSPIMSTRSWMPMLLDDEFNFALLRKKVDYLAWCYR